MPALRDSKGKLVRAKPLEVYAMSETKNKLKLLSKKLFRNTAELIFWSMELLATSCARLNH